MSHVVNVILKTDMDESIDEIDQWLEVRNLGKLHQVDEYGANGKSMEVNVFIGAFNYLPIREFVDVVKAHPWEYPDGVDLFIQDQGESSMQHFTIG